MTIYPLRLSNVPYAAKAQEVLEFVKNEGIKDLEVFLSIHPNGTHQGSTDGNVFVLLFNYVDVAKCLRLSGMKIRDRTIQVEESSLEQMKEYELVPTPSPSLFVSDMDSRQKYMKQNRIHHNTYHHSGYDSEYSHRKNHHQLRDKLTHPNNFSDRDIRSDAFSSYRKRRRDYGYTHYGNVSDRSYSHYPAENAHHRINLYTAGSEQEQTGRYDNMLDWEKSYGYPNGGNTYVTDSDGAYKPTESDHMYLKLFPVPRDCTENDILVAFQDITVCKEIIFVNFEAGPHRGKPRGEVLVKVASNQHVYKLLSSNQIFIGTIPVMVAIPSTEEIETARWQSQLGGGNHVDKFNQNPQTIFSGLNSFKKKTTQITPKEGPEYTSSYYPNGVDIPSYNDQYTATTPQYHNQKNEIDGGNSYYNLVDGNWGNYPMAISQSQTPNREIGVSTNDPAVTNHFNRKYPNTNNFSYKNDKVNKKMIYVSNANHKIDNDESISYDPNGNEMGCFVKLTKIPSSIQGKDIIDFFRGYNLIERSITPHKSKIPGPYNDWTLRFSSVQEASKALRNSKNKTIRNYSIQMSIISAFPSKQPY